MPSGRYIILRDLLSPGSWTGLEEEGWCLLLTGKPFDSQVAFAAELNNLRGGAQAALAHFPSLGTGFEREVKIEL